MCDRGCGPKCSTGLSRSTVLLTNSSCSSSPSQSMAGHSKIVVPSIGTATDCGSSISTAARLSGGCGFGGGTVIDRKALWRSTGAILALPSAGAGRPERARAWLGREWKPAWTRRRRLGGGADGALGGHRAPPDRLDAGGPADGPLRPAIAWTYLF